jgi:hypothetical protein
LLNDSGASGIIDWQESTNKSPINNPQATTNRQSPIKDQQCSTDAS